MFRLELFQRQARDERLLASYVPRREQEEAFLSLIHGASPAWALHFIGYGGSGKTMLLRRIKTNYAREHNLAIARIDFDNLNPNYPARSPGLLLMGFAEELRLTDDEASVDLFRGFDSAMRAVHERLESAFRSGTRAMAGGVAQLEASYARAEAAFIDALTQIAETATPVLILDTCEELAKARTGNNLPTALLTTFEILERLQGAVRKLRVVLSGRRMLAGAGHGWRSPGSTLPERNYLRLVELRGFDREEADAFLDRYHEGERRVPPELRGVILRQSQMRERSIVEGVAWNLPASESAASDRYNPFDIDLFASLACGEPPPTPEQMARGGEIFVRERIANRLSLELREILVDLAILGRFDRELLESLTGKQGIAFDPIWNDLKEQEWCDVDRTGREGAEIWSMEQHVRERVCRFFRADADVWHAARRRLAPLLRDLTSERVLKELTPSYFIVALDVLSDQPEEAARWWSGVERRLAKEAASEAGREAAWNWAEEITAQLVDHEDPARLGQSGMRAAVLATRAAAMLRLGPDDLAYLWDQVLEHLDHHPLQEERPALRYRALSGGIARRRFLPDPSAEFTIPEFERMVEAVPQWRDLPESFGSDLQVIGSEIALLESCAEILERVQWRMTPSTSVLAVAASVLTILRGRAAELRGRPLPTPLAVYAELLEARFQAIGGAEDVLDVVGSDAVPPIETEFLDWLRPQDLAARIRLELARLNRWHLGPIELAPLRRFESLDDDRLHALWLMAASDRSLVELDLGAGIARSVELSRRGPKCVAHAVVPPFFAVALEMRAATGDVLGALAELQEISANGNVLLEVRQAAERAAIRVITKYRLHDRIRTVAGVLQQSTRLADAVSLFGMNAFDSARSSPDYHGRWREAVDWLKTKGQETGLAASTDADAGFAQFSLALDMAEDATTGATVPFDVSEAALLRWEKQHPRAEIQRATLRARLGLDPKDDLGPRRIAEIFFEEGSLLALRQPRKGAQVLEAAARFYGTARDVTGERLSMIAAALAWARAGDRKRLGNAVQAQVLELPEPNDVLGHSWAMRLRFARTRMTEFDMPGVVTAGLLSNEELLNLMSAGLPLDLRDVLATAPIDALRRSRAKRFRALQLIVSVIVGVAVVGGAVYLMLWTLQSAARWFGYTPSLLEVAGWLGLSSVAIAVAPRLFRLYVQTVARLFRLEIHVAPQGPVPDPNRPLAEAKTTITSIVKFPFFGPLSSSKPTIELVPATKAETYAEQSVALFPHRPRTIGKPPWLLGVKIPVGLAVDPRCAAVCWEAVFARRGPTRANVRRNPFVYRRIGISGPAAPGSFGMLPIEAPVQIAFWASGLGQEAISRLPWASLRETSRAQLLVSSSFDTRDAHRMSILHIMCDAMEGAGGLELRLSRANAGIEPSEDPAGAAGGLSPRALARLPSGPPRLCLLQGLPSEGRRRSTTDRYAAGLMRRAAAELFDAGVGAVFVIPRVPERIMMRVAAPVVAAVGRRGGAAALLKAVPQVQEIIADELGDDPAIGLEIISDVCLYCLPNLNLKLGLKAS